MNEMQKVMRKVRFETEAERYDRECNDYEYEQLQRDWPDNLQSIAQALPITAKNTVGRSEPKPLNDFLPAV